MCSAWKAIFCSSKLEEIIEIIIISISSKLEIHITWTFTTSKHNVNVCKLVDGTWYILKIIVYFTWKNNHAYDVEITLKLEIKITLFQNIYTFLSKTKHEKIFFHIYCGISSLSMTPHGSNATFITVTAVCTTFCATFCTTCMYDVLCTL